MPTQKIDRVAIVTGASRGIGAAVAKWLAAQKTAVVVNYVRDADAAAATVKAIQTAGGQAIAVQADLAHSANAAALFAAAERAFGGADILVNNAGIMTLGSIAETTDDQLDRAIATNLTGVFRLLREAAHRLRDGGRIINFSSSVVGLYQPRYGVYAATKAAVEAMTHILAKELAARQITVNAIAPGPVETDLFLTDKTEEQVRTIAAMNPFKRLGRPEEIAAAVAFLASHESNWISGQVIRANGGMI